MSIPDCLVITVLLITAAAAWTTWIRMIRADRRRP